MDDISDRTVHFLTFAATPLIQAGIPIPFAERSLINDDSDLTIHRPPAEPGTLRAD